MKKILFFTSSIEHTTHRKVAEMLHREGACVTMVGFTRYNFPATECSSFEIKPLGVVSHGSYANRFLKLVKLLPNIRKHIKAHDVVYCFTLDGLLMCKLAALFYKKKWVYQVQDIRPIFFGGSFKNKLARFLEKLTLKKIDLLVLSSPDFYQNHYKRLYGFDINKTIIIENKLIDDEGIKPDSSEKTNEGKLVIGYFGVMRCARSWEILRDFVASKKENFELYLRGKPDAMPHLEHEIKGIDNIYYGGLYRSPEELGDLYNKVDIVWACYPYSEKQQGNWKMARTIRFYEALAFGKPVIVQVGTAQEVDVLKYNIGLVIDMAYPEAVFEALSTVTHEKLNEWMNNIKKLDKGYYFHSCEYQKLLNTVSHL